MVNSEQFVYKISVVLKQLVCFLIFCITLCKAEVA